MLEALTPIGVLAGIIIAAVTAFRSERSNQRAKEQSAEAARTTAEAAEVIRLENARTEYIEILEKEQLIVKSALADALKRIAILEAAEQVCQQERATLIAENSRLRRLVDKIP